MKPDRKISKAVGILVLVQMVAAVLSYSIILEPMLYSPDYLHEMALNFKLVNLAMLLDVTCGAMVFAIAILLFPILRKFNQDIARWYIGQRLIEWVCLIVSGILLLTLLKIGQDISTGDAIHLEVVAIYLRTARGQTQNISLVIYCLGAWPLYGLLYNSTLIPRFISVWGFVSVTLLFAEIISSIYGSSLGGMVIMMPLGLNEIFLGIWLIVKGFNPKRLNVNEEM